MSTSAPNNDKSQQYECFEMSLLTKCQRGSGHSTSFSSQPKTTLHDKEIVSSQECKSKFLQKSKKSTKNAGQKIC